jgi:hypothetical protein
MPANDGDRGQWSERFDPSAFGDAGACRGGLDYTVLLSRTMGN